MQNTADPFPNLLKFIKDLDSEIKQFEDFFDSFPNEELVKDICKFGKLYFPDEDISGIFEFSRRFNAFITYIDEDTELTEAREFSFVHPYEVSIWKRDENYYLLYRVDSERNAIFVDPEPEILDDLQRNVLNNFTVKAMNLFYTLPKSTELNSKIGAVAERIQKVDSDKKWDWHEQYKVYQS